MKMYDPNRFLQRIGINACAYTSSRDSVFYATEFASVLTDLNPVEFYCVQSLTAGDLVFDLFEQSSVSIVEMNAQTLYINQRHLVIYRITLEALAVPFFFEANFQ